MDIHILESELRACHPGALLAAPRILEKATASGGALSGSSVAMARGYVVMPRQDLFRRVEPGELGITPTLALPETVYLIARPTDDDIARTRSHPSLGQQPPREEIDRQEREARRLRERCGKLLFQALVEEALTGPGWNTAEAAATLGMLDIVAREEIRATLEAEGRLDHAAADEELAREFLVYLALLDTLEAERLPICLPILDRELLGRLMLRIKGLVNLAGLAAQCRPLLVSDGDKADPEVEPDPYVLQLEASAERCHAGRDLVGAACAMIQVARLSTGDRSSRAEDLARSHLRELAAGLAGPLHLAPADVARLETRLYPVLEKADQGRFITNEQRLLLELQAIMSESERPARSLDIYRWLTSAGTRPVSRQLPHQDMVQASRRLQAVLRYLPGVRVDEADSAALRDIFRGSLATCRDALRDRFQPFLEDALDDVGLQPRHPLERVSRRKLVRELIDRILADGYFSYFDVRDAISRNSLKLPDITERGEWGADDPLLRLDRHLTFKFEGIYQSGQFHAKALQNLTSALFGTHWGRLFWSYVVAPYGIALLLVSIGIILARHLPGGAGKQDEVSPVGSLLSWLWIGVIGTALSYTLANDSLRSRVASWLLWSASGLHWLVEDLPVLLARHPAFRAAVLVPLRLAWYLAIKPGLAILALHVFTPLVIPNLVIGAATWFLLALVMTTRPFLLLDRRLAEIVVDFVHAVRAGLVGRLFEAFDRIYKTLFKAVETALVRADEALRSRSDDSGAMTALRASASLVWVPLRATGRLLFVVLIEPMIHPLKLPVCFVAAKVLYPVLGPMGTESWIPAMAPLTGYWPAMTIVTTAIFLMPNVFGFLFWEFRENRGLYEANRPGRPRTAPAGPDGEDMRALMEPGWHGGTLPRIFSRLRRAGRPAAEGGDRARERQALKQLEDVRESVAHFLRRNLVDPLAVSPGWAGDDPRQWSRPLEVGSVSLSTHRVRGHLVADDGHPALTVTFEFRGGSLWAHVAAGPWLSGLPAERRQGVALAVAWCLCAAGTQLNDEQVERILGAGSGAMVSSEQALQLSVGGRELRYRLDSRHDEWAITRESDTPDRQPVVVRPAWSLRFQDMPWRYDDFTARWRTPAPAGAGTTLDLAGQEIRLVSTEQPE